MAAMSELDRVKQQIAYLKYWQGIMVVTAISVIGWFLTSPDDRPGHISAMAVLAAAALVFGIVVLHREIARRIDRLGDL